MEPEPSLAALLEAISALTATVGSLQDQIKSQGEQITQLTAICKETNNLVGDKDQGGAQTKAWPIDWACMVRPGSKLPSALQEGQDLTPRRKKSQGDSRKSLKERLGNPSVPSLPLTQGPRKKAQNGPPHPYKGDTRGRKATQWLDRMLLWVALHRDQFDEEEANVPQSDGELDWNTEAYIAQFVRGLHWKVKELLSTKDNIPDDDLEAIFAASIKIDNIRRENEENRPKKAPAKPPVTATTSTSTTTTRVRLSEDPNYVTPEERDHRRASGLCVKCGQKGHGIKQCPNGWKATIKEVAKIAEDVESGKD
ncbi:hypothetical protein RHS01_05393 [Rhizoctonia solani]|uniref:CCHC-type domain-containing protein n=1 Tax=Rhizoctonia solani TaxID=456999 RepID=A0A8H7IEZ8_9AGAM|nr:hypothetical protein RHS01_05393 [Rhizoctonia solani]